MAVLVTGASGFLGGRVASMLAEQGAEVRTPGRRDIIRGGLHDLRDVTHIYHCAGCSTDWAPWRTFYESNVALVSNLLQAAAQAPRLERFLHVSTTDVYGYPAEPCGESHAPADAGLPYNRSKRMGEALVWAANLPFTIVRPATIYGPRGKAFTIDIAKLLRQGAMAVIDRGRAPGGFCYIDNAAQAILAAAASPATLGRAYNLSDGTGATWRTYVDALAAGLGLRPPRIDIPFAVAFALARAMEAPYRYLRFPGRPALTRHAVYLLGRNQEYPIDAARRDFSLAPRVSFEEGMARSVEWLKEREMEQR